MAEHDTDTALSETGTDTQLIPVAEQTPKQTPEQTPNITPELAPDIQRDFQQTDTPADPLQGSGALTAGHTVPLTVSAADPKAFGASLEDIATGRVVVSFTD
jgi:hypothetical protein